MLHEDSIIVRFIFSISILFNTKPESNQSCKMINSSSMLLSNTSFLYRTSLSSIICINSKMKLFCSWFLSSRAVYTSDFLKSVASLQYPKNRSRFSKSSNFIVFILSGCYIYVNHQKLLYQKYSNMCLYAVDYIFLKCATGIPLRPRNTFSESTTNTRQCRCIIYSYTLISRSSSAHVFSGTHLNNFISRRLLTKIYPGLQQKKQL